MTLRHTDPSLHKEFQRFAIDEMIFTLPYFIVLFIVYVAQRQFRVGEFKLYVAFQEPLCILVIILLSKKFKQHIMCGFLLLSITSNGISLLQVIAGI